MLLDWAVLTVSFFITICLFWLGLMVLLNGDRRLGGVWLVGIGLLLAGLFFISHTAILGRGIAEVGFGMDFWWWVSWTPAVVAPYTWYASMAWYAGFRLRGKLQPHRFGLGAVSALAVLVVLLLFFANPLPRFDYVAGRVMASTPAIAGVPVLILAYIIYLLACFLLPLDLLLRADPAQDPLRANARHLARPWLMGASLSLLAAGGVLAWTALWALNSPGASLSNPAVAHTVKEFDLAVASLVGLAIILLGRAIVAYEVFTGRPLPRLGFFRRWRSTVLLAGGFGAVTAWTLVIGLLPVYSLMLSTGLVALFYALYSWRSFKEREVFMNQLRPFVASQDLYGAMVRPAPEASRWAAGERFFTTLCRDVLAVRAARLVPLGSLATLAGSPLVMGALEPPETGEGSLAWIRDHASRSHAQVYSSAGHTIWAAPLWNERELGGVLFLGEKIDGNPFTDEEMDLAQAGGERLLDMLAGLEMARVAIDLMRQRMTHSRVAEGHARRQLHDEILPLLHAAILELSGEPNAQTAVQQLADAHHKISDLVRDIPAPLPDRLAQLGFPQAFREMVENEYQGDFKVITWDLDGTPAELEKACAPFDLSAQEVVFYAARELVRNAARYAGGKKGPGGVCLTIHVAAQDGLTVCVEDDGCGLAASAPSGAGGNGLRLHGAMLAAVGGTLEVTGRIGGGVRGVIRLELADPQPAAG